MKPGITSGAVHTAPDGVADGRWLPIKAEWMAPMEHAMFRGR